MPTLTSTTGLGGVTLASRQKVIFHQEICWRGRGSKTQNYYLSPLSIIQNNNTNINDIQNNTALAIAVLPTTQTQPMVQTPTVACVVHFTLAQLDFLSIQQPVWCLCEMAQELVPRQVDATQSQGTPSSSSGWQGLPYWTLHLYSRSFGLFCSMFPNAPDVTCLRAGTATCSSDQVYNIPDCHFLLKLLAISRASFLFTSVFTRFSSTFKTADLIPILLPSFA